MMRSRYCLIVLSVVVALAAVAVVVSAGDPDNPPGPPETTLSYTLEDLYDRLDTGAAGAPSTFTEPDDGPSTGTMHTLNDMMSVAPEVDDADGAAQADILAGQTAWGLTSGAWGRMTGTMADNGAVTMVPATVQQTIAAGYHNGSGYVEGDADLLAANIKAGASIFGVDGTLYAPVPRTGQTASYAVGDDGDLQAGVESPNPRFIIGATGVATDTLTGLIWLQNANCFGARTWAQAVSDVNGLASGSCGLTDDSIAGDWRLPNVREMLSLFDYGQYPAMPLEPVFYGYQTWYWSSTSYANDPANRAYRLTQNTGMVEIAYKTNVYSALAVRGGE